MEIESGAAELEFNDKTIRNGFVKKVFIILGIQLVVTGGLMCIFMFVPPVKEYCTTNTWPYITAVCVYFVFVIVLACVGDIRRRFPINLICLMIVTVAMGVMLGCIAASFDADEVLMAIGVTAIVCLAMIGLGLQTKFDFTWMLGGLTALTLCLICFGFMVLIFNNDVLYMFYACLGAFIFSMWLVVDIQLMMGGKNKMSIDPEEYILAALNLYLDMVNIFLYILMIFSNS